MITALTRTLILYVLIMLGLRLTGKRQIGELEPSELVLTMLLSDLAAIPMQDFGIPLLFGIIPILTLLALSMLVSQLSLISLRFREIVCGKPAILINKGHLQQEVMRKNRFTIDELMEELRGQGYSNIQDIKYAVLENSGQLSVLPWTQQQPPTVRQLGLQTDDETTLPVILINDGRILQNNLARCRKDNRWLQQVLKKEGLSSPQDAFLLTLDETGTIFCIKKEIPSCAKN